MTYLYSEALYQLESTIYRAFLRMYGRKLKNSDSKIKEAVMELDEKRGTRLYGIASFMLFYFEKKIMSYGVKAMLPEQYYS